MSRYSRSTQIVNDTDQYKDTFEKRGVKKVIQYRTPAKTVYEQELYDSVETTNYIWKYGDTYANLASVYYADPTLWWVIASFNKKPTEFHNQIGDTIKIPVSLAEALQVVG